MPQKTENLIHIPSAGAELEGELIVPPEAEGLVIFAHGSGSSRKSPRNNFVAEQLRDRTLGTLLFDLLTEEEDRDRENRFDMELLTDRLNGVTDWLEEQDQTSDLKFGYFGSSTGAAAALKAASRRGNEIDAVVSRGGRVDLAEAEAPQVTAPTLLIVGGEDHTVLDLNRQVLDLLPEQSQLEVVEGAGHLFEGPGELDRVAELAANWFEEYLES